MMPRSPLPIATLVLFAAAVDAAAAPPGVNFSREILPILSDNCFACHGPDAKARKAKLRLDTKEGAFRLRDGVAVVVPGKSATSELYTRIASADETEVMPPPKSKKKLTTQQIELVKRWIDEGAPWGKHWSFEKPRRAELPAVKSPAWPQNAIDYFILARLEKQGLQPSPEAPRETLIRRVSLDLTGLPPTPDEVDAFLTDKSPDAYEKVVDRLLKSPRYGERMAWDWLDAARYADSNGYQGDQDRTMWPWRDWVVQAFNANMPFDRFTVEQLAGDLLPGTTRDQKLATAFNRNHMINGEGGRIPEENRIDYLVDQTDTTATIWLGVTLGCARCHDHKYDPFTMRDYYQMLAYFNRTPVNGGGGSGKTAPLLDFDTREQDQRRKDLTKQVDDLVQRVRDKESKLREAGTVQKGKSTLPSTIDSALRKGPSDRNDQSFNELVGFYKAREPVYIADLQNLRKVKQARDALNSSVPQVMVMEDMAKPRDTFMLVRGAYDKPSQKVEPALPALLLPLPQHAPRNRLALAHWLVDKDHPLTARVTVNRAWQTFFGTGLVKTVEEFGVQGERPTHAALLDWLATEFTRSGWNVKSLQKLIVMSAAYRQSSKATPELLEHDPENRLLGRGPRFRLPSWMIRDQALAVSGLLVEQLGGPPVRPYQPPGIWEEATFGSIRYNQDHGPSLYRRSLYVFWRRIVGPTMFFDVASRQTCTVKAVRTNTPLHALTTLNDTTYVEAGRMLAQRVLQQAGAPAERIATAFRLVTARRPSSEEAAILQKSYDRLRSSFAADRKDAEKLLKIGESPRNPRLDVVEHAAMTSLCALILNLDEALTRQ
jgi:mono/diheme cytochrome c family protein